MKTFLLALLAASLPLLTLSPTTARTPAAQRTFTSPDGSHVATFAQLSDDPRPARRSMWQLTMLEDRGPRGRRKLWSVIGPEPDPSSSYLVADDGSAVCRVAPDVFSATAKEGDDKLVEVWSRGRRSGAFDAEELQVTAPSGSSAETKWILPAPDTLRRRSVRFGTSSKRTVLDLLCVDGGLRTIDLSNNSVAVSADASDVGVYVLPPVPTDLETKLEPVFVRSWSAAEETPGGLGLAVRVRGSLPEPGWTVVGYAVEIDDEDKDRPRIVLTPYAAGLAGGAIITHFDSTCTLFVPRPGSYLLEVRGSEEPGQAQPLEVLPTALFVSLTVSGGFAGTRQDIVAHRDGRLSADGRVSLLPTDTFAELVERVRALPGEGTSARSLGSDMFQYDLTWVPPSESGRVARVTFDDGTLNAPWRDVVTMLMELARRAPLEAPSPAAFTIDAKSSNVLVRTGTDGLLKRLGHEHTIRVGDVKGEVVADPSALDQARLVLTVEAASLAVIDTKKDADRVAIDKKMHAEVLASEEHGQITFRSTHVEAKQLAEGRFETVIDGDLTLRGVTRPVRVSANVEFTADGLRARGRGSLKLSDFGLDAPKALGGTINVADKVELRFDVRAR